VCHDLSNRKHSLVSQGLHTCCVTTCAIDTLGSAAHSVSSLASHCGCGVVCAVGHVGCGVIGAVCHIGGCLIGLVGNLCGGVVGAVSCLTGGLIGTLGSSSAGLVGTYRKRRRRVTRASVKTMLNLAAV
jgi:hypothetical protein